MSARELWAEVAKKYPVNEETISATQKTIDHGFKPWHAMTVEECRQTFDVYSTLQKPRNFDGSIEEKNVPSSHCKEGIPVTIYQPASKKPVPALVLYLHGGGLIMGSRKIYDNVAKTLAQKSGAVVIHVEYRLLPNAEDLLAPFNDAETVARWVLNNKEELGGRPDSKVGVGGDSAGGQLTSSVLHDVNGLDFSYMIYPVADLDRTTPSFQTFMDIPAFCGKDMIMMFDSTNPPIPKVESNPRVNPAARTGLGSDPPLLVILAQLDPLRDWGQRYAEKMKREGGEVKLSMFEGVPHGFCFDLDGFPESSDKALQEIAEFINQFQH